MNRKQVNAFLKVMSKDNTRTQLQVAKIDKIGDKTFLVATDGYMLTAVFIDDIEEQYIGKQISRQAIERWYKLANCKSILNADSIQDLLEDDVVNDSTPTGNFVPWKGLFSEVKPKNTKTIQFNANFMKINQELNQEDSIKYFLSGELGAMVSHTNVGYTFIMPVKQV